MRVPAVAGADDVHRVEHEALHEGGVHLFQQITLAQVGATAAGGGAGGVADELAIDAPRKEDDAGDFGQFLLVGFGHGLVVIDHLDDFPRLIHLAVAVLEGVGQHGFAHVVAVLQEVVDGCHDFLVEELAAGFGGVEFTLDIHALHVLVADIENAAYDVGIVAALLAVADEQRGVGIDIAAEDGVPCWHGVIGVAILVVAHGQNYMSGSGVLLNISGSGASCKPFQVGGWALGVEGWQDIDLKITVLCWDGLFRR